MAWALLGEKKTTQPRCLHGPTKATSLMTARGLKKQANAPIDQKPLSELLVHRVDWLKATENMMYSLEFPPQHCCFLATQLQGRSLTWLP